MAVLGCRSLVLDNNNNNNNKVATHAISRNGTESARNIPQDAKARTIVSRTKTSTVADFKKDIYAIKMIQ